MFICGSGYTSGLPCSLGFRASSLGLKSLFLSALRFKVGFRGFRVEALAIISIHEPIGPLW